MEIAPTPLIANESQPRETMAELARADDIQVWIDARLETVVRTGR